MLAYYTTTSIRGAFGVGRSVALLAFGVALTLLPCFLALLHRQRSSALRIGRLGGWS